MKGGSYDIKKHRFFKDVPFEQILKESLKAPYIPKIDEIERNKKLNGMLKYDVKTIPENRDKVKSPAMDEKDDPFIDWFDM